MKEKAIQIVENKIIFLNSLTEKKELFKSRILILKDIIKDLKKEL